MARKKSEKTTPQTIDEPFILSRLEELGYENVADLIEDHPELEKSKSQIYNLLRGDIPPTFKGTGAFKSWFVEFAEALDCSPEELLLETETAYVPEEEEKKNPYFLKKIREAGYKSLRQFSTDNKDRVAASSLLSLAGKDIQPFTVRGYAHFTRVARNVADILNCEPDELFPPDVLCYREMDAGKDINAFYLLGAAYELVPDTLKPLKERIDEVFLAMLQELPLKEGVIMVLRTGAFNYDKFTTGELASEEVFNAYPQTITALEHSALKRLTSQALYDTVKARLDPAYRDALDLLHKQLREHVEELSAGREIGEEEPPELGPATPSITSPKTRMTVAENMVYDFVNDMPMGEFAHKYGMSEDQATDMLQNFAAHRFSKLFPKRKKLKDLDELKENRLAILNEIVPQKEWLLEVDEAWSLETMDQIMDTLWGVAEETA